MNVLVLLHRKLEEAREKMTELKLWLNQKEVVEYYRWKEENPKDRTAMEKVVAQLKMVDDEWLLKEKEYVEVKNEYDRLKAIYDMVNNMMYSQQYTKEDIENFVADLV